MGTVEACGHLATLVLEVLQQCLEQMIDFSMVSIMFMRARRHFADTDDVDALRVTFFSTWHRLGSANVLMRGFPLADWMEPT